MIEKKILDYLTTALTVPVYMEIPEDPPVKFVTIMKTGSGVSNHIYHAMIALRSHGASLLEAAELNEAVKDAMDAATTLENVSSSKLNSDYNYTDPTTRRYRYQAVFDVIYHKGE